MSKKRERDFKLNYWDMYGRKDDIPFVSAQIDAITGKSISQSGKI